MTPQIVSYYTIYSLLLKETLGASNTLVVPCEYFRVVFLSETSLPPRYLSSIGSLFLRYEWHKVCLRKEHRSFVYFSPVLFCSSFPMVLPLRWELSPSIKEWAQRFIAARVSFAMPNDSNFCFATRMTCSRLIGTPLFAQMIQCLTYVAIAVVQVFCS